MAIIGIETLVYGVDDIALCTKYFNDFGLPLIESSATESRFQLEDGSNVIIRHITDPSLPESAVMGTGVREIVWGVDSQSSLDRLTADLGRDREIKRESDGSVRFLSDCGLPLALRIYAKKKVITAPDPLNSPGNVNRLNRPRKWLMRARPKTIQHVVFTFQDFQKSFDFFKDRLGFRLSDYQEGFGIYARCDGANNHHNIFFMNAHASLPGHDGNVRFHHVNFGVADIDEIMIGANHMERCGWDKSHLGLGRHRIDSALFYYIPSPTGGETEYGADGDYVDDSWIPRRWKEPLFGYLSFVHNVPPFFQEPPAWDVEYFEGYTPAKKRHHE